ncbi:hypothetical protein BC943DRAFT_136582 [Umbelopsis sp. AD052]|nr:hypothetical protein BC943DRAFT_136582 [Umbelopsis sp. AD052]
MTVSLVLSLLVSCLPGVWMGYISYHGQPSRFLRFRRREQPGTTRTTGLLKLFDLEYESRADQLNEKSGLQNRHAQRAWPTENMTTHSKKSSHPLSPLPPILRKH